MRQILFSDTFYLAGKVLMIILPFADSTGTGNASGRYALIAKYNVENILYIASCVIYYTFTEESCTTLI